MNNADQQPAIPEATEDEDYVRWAYRVLLGKEPSPSLPAELKADHDRLLRTILNSPEFRLRFVSQLGQFARSPYSSWNREAVAFIHLHKTGGTTFHSLLSACFPSDRVCPERFETLHLWTPSDLANYDLFSGHFDYFALKYIPRRRIRTVSMFRDPIERQISLYRFARAHSPDEFAHDKNVQLANALSAEEYFEHEHIVRQKWYNNTYLLVFGASLYDQATFNAILADTLSDPAPARRDELVTFALTRAKDRIASLDAIGLTERFAESTEVIFGALGLPVPEAINAHMVTDNLPDEKGRYRKAPPVVMTPRLSSALERLTRFDRMLYDFARDEFERRGPHLAQAQKNQA